MIKSKFLFSLTCLVVAISSCGPDLQVENTLEPVIPGPGIAGFNFTNDPLKVELSENFTSSLSPDSVDVISNHLYNYFHYMNCGDSINMPKYFKYFPEYMLVDSAPLNAFKEATLRWKKDGLIQTIEFCEIDHISDWKKHNDTKVALVSCDIHFYQHYLPNFAGNPSGMKNFLGDMFGHDAITYTEEYRQTSKGDSVLIRNWKADSENGVFVLLEKTQEGEQYKFLIQDAVDLGGSYKENIPLKTMLDLLREERERVKK